MQTIEQASAVTVLRATNKILIGTVKDQNKRIKALEAYCAVLLSDRAEKAEIMERKA